VREIRLAGVKTTGMHIELNPKPESCLSKDFLIAAICKKLTKASRDSVILTGISEHYVPVDKLNLKNRGGEKETVLMVAHLLVRKASKLTSPCGIP